MNDNDPGTPGEGRDIFDPFDYGADETPNLIGADSAVMLPTNPSGMLEVNSADMVDPDDARTVTPDQANVIDPDEVSEVVAERAAAAVDQSRSTEPTTLALIGAPGSGKSTIGPLLAERLGLHFCDVDARIEERVGKPIGEIFAEDGEPAFRRVEEAATLDALDHSGQVVSLGGGAVMSPRIRAALAEHPVVWLEVTAGTAINRAGLNTARPLLVGNVRGTLIKLLAERTPVYQTLATVTVNNDGDDPAATVTAVVGELAELTATLGAESASEPESGSEPGAGDDDA